MIVDPRKVFTASELTAIAACYGEKEPPGEFLNERHGFTHVRIDHNEENADDKRFVVLCHGLGTSHHMYHSIAQTFLDSSVYSVITYDFYSHGYSKYRGDYFFDYNIEMFIDQLEDVIEYAESAMNGKCEAICGLSTGGLVCYAAQSRWLQQEKDKKGSTTRKPIENLVLFAPAFFATKPFMVKVVERNPALFTSIMKHFKPARGIIARNYLKAQQKAFARDPKTGETLYAVEEKNKHQIDLALLGKVKGKKKHPYIEGGLWSIVTSTLHSCSLKRLRDTFPTMLENSFNYEGDTKILWIWGDLDRTTSFEKNHEDAYKWIGKSTDIGERGDYREFSFKVGHEDVVACWPGKSTICTISQFHRHGHEIIYEDSEKVAKLTIEFLKSQINKNDSTIKKRKLIPGLPKYFDIIDLIELKSKKENETKDGGHNEKEK